MDVVWEDADAYAGSNTSSLISVVAISILQDPEEKELLKLTWSGVVRTDMTSAWGEFHPFFAFGNG